MKQFFQSSQAKTKLILTTHSIVYSCISIGPCNCEYIRPMKLDYQFLTQISEKMMRAVIIHYSLLLKTIKIG